MTPWFDSFIFGAANSLHCACMCGPLALAFQGGASGALNYHLGRSLSYGAVGVGMGGLGCALGTSELRTPSAWVAFVLAAGLIVLASLGERGALAIPGLGKLMQRAMARTRTFSPAVRAGLLGVFTPLLPCGLLWAACSGAALAGSALDGGGVMLGFALGSLPLLLLAQTQVGRLAQRFGPRPLRIMQLAALWLAAGTLVWRGIVSLNGESCCH